MKIYRGHIQNFIKRTNFLNAQNYVLGKEIVEQTNRAMNTSRDGKNVIGFQKGIDFQEMNISIIKSEENNTKWILVALNIMCFFVIFGIISEEGVVMEAIYVLLFTVIFTSVWFLPSQNKKYKFYRDRNNIIIQKIK